MKTLLLATLILTVSCGMVSAQSDNLVIVLDTSGSMGDHMRSAGKTRMEVAQDALSAVLSKVPKTTKIGILSFEGWVYELGPVDKVKLEAAIRGTRPGGGTPLYEYIRAGATRLLKEREKQGNTGYFKLLVVTDGAANDDYLNQDSKFSDGSTKLGVLRDVISRNIIVDVIALDMGEEHDLMKQNNGLDMIGDDQASLTRAVQKAVAEVGFSGGAQDTNADAFKELDGLPDDFVLAALKGLTTFQNHPIGEKPPIRVAQTDGTVRNEPDPANEVVPAPGEGEGGGGMPMGLVWGLLVVVVVVIVGFIVIGRR